MVQTELVIIGKGPAGIQASIYSQRAGVKTTVIGKDIGMCEKARHVQNFFGFESITGPELVEKGVQQAIKLGVPVIVDEVISLGFDGTYFEVKTKTESYQALSVLLASGAHRNVPRIRNINSFEGKGVSYCAVCDAFFYRKKRVCVIGHGDYAANEANELLSVSDTVYVLTDGQEPTGDFSPNVTIIKDKIKSIVGENKVSGVEFENETLDVEGVFVALGSASSMDLAQKMGIEVENNRIVVNQSQETNVPGLYAAGDCTLGVQQIAKAIGDGCTAGMNIAVYVRNRKRELGL